MNLKIEKVVFDMKRIEDKIESLQEKWQNLNKQKIELENIEIIGLIRGSKISTENLSDVLKAYHGKSDVSFAILKEENQHEKI